MIVLDFMIVLTSLYINNYSSFWIKELSKKKKIY